VAEDSSEEEVEEDAEATDQEDEASEEEAAEEEDTETTKTMKVLVTAKTLEVEAEAEEVRTLMTSTRNQNKAMEMGSARRSSQGAAMTAPSEGRTDSLDMISNKIFASSKL